jgi:hypothetical protein
MLGTESVVTATLCFASADSYMSINSSYIDNNECFGVQPKHNL